MSLDNRLARLGSDLLEKEGLLWSVITIYIFYARWSRTDNLLLANHSLLCLNSRNCLFFDLFGLNLTNNGRIITFGGGLPIVVDGEVIGGVGVSGGSVEEDMAVAEAALSVLDQPK